MEVKLRQTSVLEVQSTGDGGLGSCRIRISVLFESGMSPRTPTLLKQLSTLGRRRLSTTTTPATGRLPWFVDPTPFTRQKAPHLVQNGPAPLPEGVPSVIKNLHAVLKASPHLDQSELLVCEPIPTPPGPPLPDAIPKGRRRRGRTYAGEGVATGMVGGLWNWIVLAQVSLHTNDLPPRSEPSLSRR